MTFPNPVGLSAGFDKNAEVADAMLDAGFGFVEVGSITPQPQSGNPRPRLFRLSKDQAVINRFGFNNKGMAAAARNLAYRRGIGLVGVNLGKNKTTEDPIADYVLGAEKLAPFADYLVINVSSPNTPGLRALQSKDHLTDLIQATCESRDKAMQKHPRAPELAEIRPAIPPLFVKIAPDLEEEDLIDIADIACKSNLDGVIISNTTVARPDSLKDQKQAGEMGGLSGKPLFEKSTAVLSGFYQQTEGKIPLIGVGGISSGRDAYAKIRAGASLVQLYSALVYQGPGLIPTLKRELSTCLLADGFRHIREAVGADHR